MGDFAVLPNEQRKVIQAPDDFEILVKVTCERQRIHVLMSPIPERYKFRAVEDARSRMLGKFRRNRSLLFVRKNQHPVVDGKSCGRRTVNSNMKAGEFGHAKKDVAIRFDVLNEPMVIARLFSRDVDSPGTGKV